MGYWHCNLVPNQIRLTRTDSSCSRPASRSWTTWSLKRGPNLELSRLTRRLIPSCWRTLCCRYAFAHMQNCFTCLTRWYTVLLPTHGVTTDGPVPSSRQGARSKSNWRGQVYLPVSHGPGLDCDDWWYVYCSWEVWSHVHYEGRKSHTLLGI